MKQLNIYLFGSVLKSEIKDDLIIGECTAAQVTAGCPGLHRRRRRSSLRPRGKREAGAPKYTFGGTVRGNVGTVRARRHRQADRPALRLRHQRAGARVRRDLGRGHRSSSRRAAPAYWLVNLDARLSLADYGPRAESYLQFNVYNLFDQFYVGGFGGGLNQTITRNAAGAITGYGAPPFVQIGAPRTISATLVLGF